MATQRRPRRALSTAVYLESGRQRVFACALDWPGWCRSGKDAERALEALAAYAPRYALVAAEARLPFPARAPSGFDVVERLRGSAATDFGVPHEFASNDSKPLARKEADNLATLVAASWRVFDRVMGGAPARLRKGPRGGGRDRDAIVEHVLGAEAAYAGKLGLRLQQPDRGDRAAISACREAIAGALRGAGGSKVGGKGWPARYAARRIAWHVLDHAWETEDRSRPAPDPPR